MCGPEQKSSMQQQNSSSGSVEPDILSGPEQNLSSAIAKVDELSEPAAIAGTDDVCIFLSKTSAEIRNAIYELTFAPDQETDERGKIKEQDLVKGVKAPEKALILCCRQVYLEAGGMYKASFQKYWTTTPFVINKTSLLSAREEWRAGITHPLKAHFEIIAEPERWVHQLISEEILSKVHLLVVVDNTKESFGDIADKCVYELVDKCGVWRTMWLSGDNLVEEMWWGVFRPATRSPLQTVSGTKSADEIRAICKKHEQVSLASQIGAFW